MVAKPASEFRRNNVVHAIPLLLPNWDHLSTLVVSTLLLCVIMSICQAQLMSWTYNKSSANS